MLMILFNTLFRAILILFLLLAHSTIAAENDGAGPKVESSKSSSSTSSSSKENSIGSDYQETSEAINENNAHSDSDANNDRKKENVTNNNESNDDKAVTNNKAASNSTKTDGKSSKCCINIKQAKKSITFNNCKKCIILTCGALLDLAGALLIWDAVENNYADFSQEHCRGFECQGVLAEFGIGVCLLGLGVSSHVYLAVLECLDYRNT
jgi:hypothetical protein